MSFNWLCPYCNYAQVVTNNKIRTCDADLRMNEQKEGPLGGLLIAIGCSNSKCLKTTIRLVIRNLTTSEYRVVFHFDAEMPPIFNQIIIPAGNAKPQPEYIPAPIREDYYEACKIRDLSPKASATLIRRCLQGMIRDFAGIQKGTLNKEITDLKQAVEAGTADRSITAESVEAIDHIRTIGNIGAHMEKDINTIIDVDPNEAETLIQVTEMLFEEWYGDRHRRAERLAQVKKIADTKKEQKALPSPS